MKQHFLHRLLYGLLPVLLLISLAAWPGSLPAVCAPADAAQSPEGAAAALYDLGLFSGVGKGPDGAPDFDLDRTPTRYEAVTMLVRLLGGEAEARTGTADCPFQNMAAWAAPYVSWAWSKELTAGVSATDYGGDVPASRAQYVTFLLRALGYSSGADFAWDSPWPLSDALGLTGGDGTTAETPFTRGELAQLSCRALSAPCKSGGEILRQRIFRDGRVLAPLEVHFLDVGQADAALVLCEGHAMLIDGGNAADSSLIYSHLRRYGVDTLDLVVCTHPHEDHVGGLAGALNYASAAAAWCPVTAYDSRAFFSFQKYLDAQGVPITVPALGDSLDLGGASVQVVGPVRPSENLNNSSIVLRLTYGDVSFLFAGDAEREEELDMLETGLPLKCTVLKVGHHGSATSSSYPFLYAAEPEHAVISVGTDNTYGHPDEAVLSHLRDAGAIVWRTDQSGDILCRSDGSHVSFFPAAQPEAAVQQQTASVSPENAASAQAGTEESQPGTSDAPRDYVLNQNSHKFHLPDCSSVARIRQENRVNFHGTRAEALEMGYAPCSLCHP